MSTVFLIGNGFDLSCGMKTRYSDMYKEYCKILPNDSSLIKKFKSDIQKDVYNSWADFELGMAKYASELSNEDDFIFCLNDFKRFLIDYLKTEQNNFFKKFEDNIPLNISLQDEAKRSLSDYYKGISNNLERKIKENEAKDIKIICFNYTRVLWFLSKPALTTDSLYEYDFVQIHGSLNDETVMGIDNESQIKTTFPITNKLLRSFVKPLFNDEFDSFRNSRAERFIETADVICVYGLSLGDSDYKWRELILKRLFDSSNVQLFFYSYDLIKQENLFISQKLSLQDEKRNELIQKWHIENSDKIIDRIHFPCGQQIFCFDKIFEYDKTHHTN